MAQRRHVAIVGMGGLGCPAALALASAGVEQLTLIDGDLVDESNLQRQILYAVADVGQRKVDAAATALAARHPGLVLGRAPVRLTADNAAALLGSADVVLDGCDDPDTKFLLNDRCLELGVPLISAGCVAWRGQLLAIAPGRPCLRCLFEAPPADVDSCALTGILGAWAGVVGARAAEWALAILDGGLATLPRGLVSLDGWAGSERLISFQSRSDCAACTAAATAGIGRRMHTFRKGDAMAKVRIPTPLRKYTAGAEEVEATGATVGAVLTDLEARYPGIRERIFDDKGAVRRFVNIFVRDEDIRFQKQLETPVADADEISIVPAIAGG